MYFKRLFFSSLASSSFTYYITLNVIEQKFVHIFKINIRIADRTRFMLSHFYSSPYQRWSDKNKMFNTNVQQSIFDADEDLCHNL